MTSPTSPRTDDPLDAAWQVAAARLVAAYGRVEAALRLRVRALVVEIAAAEAAGAVVNATLIRRLLAEQGLADAIARELNDFAALARFEAGALADEAVGIGLRVAAARVATQGEAGALAATVWRDADAEMLARLIGYVDGPAMRAKFARFGADAARQFGDLVIALTAQGKGSRTIARALDAWLHVPFGWAENLVRTAQAYSYRGATAASFQANADLLDGWMWEAALDARTCLSCIAQHGTIHPITETLDDHWRGRCEMVPIVKGTTWARDAERGRDWFERLPEGTQRRIAGDLLWTALRQGDVGWEQISRIDHDDVFGDMLREASVKEVVNDPARYAALRELARGLAANATTAEMAAFEAAAARIG